MASESLTLAKDLSVPRGIASRTVFVAGTKGSGKTYSGGVLAEELLGAGVHLAILDPLGVWWGLRHDESGGPGGYPIVILGGEHADVPLLPTGGEAVADFIVKSGQSCILDMSGFDSDAEQDRFVTAMLKRLFRLKASDKANLHLIMDEADMFAPQSPMPGQQVMLGATKTIVTKGRSRGLSMTMITQRPQSIATALRDEADIFLCHRIQGPRAADAVETWVEQHATPGESKAFMASLPTLKDGECWVWSPSFLKTFQRVQFRRKSTFDSSRTPDPGETVRKPKAAAKVDLEKLTAEIRATAEAAKANDPTALKRQVAELRKQLDSQPATKTVEKVKEVPILGEQHVKRLEGIAVKLQAEGTRMVETGEKMLAEAAAVRQTITSATARLAGAVAPARAAMPVRQTLTRPPVVQRVARPADSSGGLGKAERRILTALAQSGPSTKNKVAVIAAYAVNGGGFNNALSRCRSQGWLEGSDRLQITEAGAQALGEWEPLPSGAELIEHWKRQLGKAEGMVLQTLVANPGGLTKEQVAEAAGYAADGGGFNNALSRLRTLELIEGRGELRLSAELAEAVTA